MTVYKRDGSTRWQIEFVFNGRNYRKSSGTSDKRLAERVEDEWRRSLVRQASLGEAVPMTLAEAVLRYARTVLAPRGGTNLASTGLSYASRLRGLCVEFGEATRLEALTAPRISEWKSKLLASGRAPATVDRNLDLLRSVLNRAAHEWGALASVPVIGKLKLKIRNGRTRFLSEAEEAALLASCASEPDLADVVTVALDTGGRRGDLLQLQWAEVHWTQGLVAFMRPKNDQPRSVPMTARVRAILERRKRPDGPVFPYDPVTLTRKGCRSGSRGAPRKDDQAGMRAAWEEAIDRAALAGLRFHDLRHTFASRLVMRGASLYVVGELLGHRDPKMTKRYAHLAPKMHSDALALLEPPLGPRT